MYLQLFLVTPKNKSILLKTLHGLFERMPSTLLLFQGRRQEMRGVKYYESHPLPPYPITPVHGTKLCFLNFNRIL